MKLIILLSAMALSSCAGTVCKPAKLPLPNENVYPKIQASELTCLSDETYKKLNKGKTICRERIKTLRNIIKATH